MTQLQPTPRLALRAPRWPLLGLALAALFAATACLTFGAAAPTIAPAPTSGLTAASTTPAGTPAPAQSAVASPADTQAAPAGTPTPIGLLVPVEGTVAFGAGSVDLIQPAIGLADLSSYHALLILSFTGTEAGQAQQWSKTYELLSALTPAARQLTIAKTGDNADPEPLFLAEVNGAAYERHGAAGCIASVFDPASSQVALMEPAGFLIAVIGAEPAGSDTVNGVAANHFTFDERALGQAGLATTTGEMWLAATGGYLVKYTLTTSGDASTFGDGIVGTLTVDYELTNVNQPVTLQLPDDCPAGLVSAPRLPDATNVVDLPGLLSYDTAASPADAVAFYQQQLPALGWAALDVSGAGENSLLLEYTQADQKLTLLVSTGAGVTTVTLDLGPSGLVNAPQLPDATNVQNEGGQLTYDTAASLADAAAFYQTQMPALGWTSLGEPSLTDSTALLNFTQADQTLTIFIITSEGVTTVTIAQTP